MRGFYVVKSDFILYNKHALKGITYFEEVRDTTIIQDDMRNVCTQLLTEMKEGIFSDCDKLPRETVLSEKLGISRTQLRDALAELESEGFITRRHGVGTVINRHVLQVKNRMDIETEFLEIIRQNGYRPAISYVQEKEEKADAYLAGKLNIPEGTLVVRVCRICTADERPAIYCEDVLEKRFVRGDYTRKDLESPIFYFMKKFCGREAYMDLTQLHAVAAGEVVARALNVSVGAPLLNMEEVDYDIEGTPILYSSQYFSDELIEQTVLRKKL